MFLFLSDALEEHSSATKYCWRGLCKILREAICSSWWFCWRGGGSDAPWETHRAEKSVPVQLFPDARQAVPTLEWLNVPFPGGILWIVFVKTMTLKISRVALKTHCIKSYYHLEGPREAGEGLSGNAASSKLRQFVNEPETAVLPSGLAGLQPSRYLSA